MGSSEKPPGVPGSEEDDTSREMSEEEEAEAARAANKFDIRRLIGGLFCFYSLILIALGIFGSHASKNKAAGVNINLWTGLGMLVFGCLMIFWALSRPVAPTPEESRGDRSGQRPAPAT